MTSSPFRDAPGAMAEIRRLRIASAPSTVYLHGTPVVVRLRDGPRWQINVQRERARLVENRGESELKSCENPPQVSEYRVGYSCIARSHLPQLRPGLGNGFSITVHSSQTLSLL